MEYVVGFIFTPDMLNLWLIRKDKGWQSGLLNGVGGKVEEGESPDDAMEREALEESGYEGRWEKFAELKYPNEYIHFFWSVWVPDYEVPVTHELEEIEYHTVLGVNMRDDVVPNLRWLIPAAVEHINNPLQPMLRGGIS